jgi:hypothetical protein
MIVFAQPIKNLLAVNFILCKRLLAETIGPALGSLDRYARNRRIPSVPRITFGSEVRLFSTSPVWQD